MKQRIHKVTAITMAVLLLASTVSWTVEQHFCMGRLYDIAFFTSANKCGMELSAEEGLHSSHSCCDDTVFSMDGRRDLKPSLHTLQLGHPVFLAAFSAAYTFLFETGVGQPLPNEYYPPPLIVRDIHLLEGVFLI